MKKTREPEIEALRMAVERERQAADELTAVLATARALCASLDAPGLRRAVLQAAESFDALTRAASLRNAAQTREAGELGLPRQATLADLLDRLGEPARPLAEAAKELSASLAAARRELRAQGLIARYGLAMTTNLMDMRRPPRAQPSYGATGRRQGAYTRAGRVA